MICVRLLFIYLESRLMLSFAVQSPNAVYAADIFLCQPIDIDNKRISTLNLRLFHSMVCWAVGEMDDFFLIGLHHFLSVCPLIQTCSQTDLRPLCLQLRHFKSCHFHK